MASLRERRRADGSTAYAEPWRDPRTGRQSSMTYASRNEVRVAMELLEAAHAHAMTTAVRLGYRSGARGGAVVCATPKGRRP